MKEKSFSKEKIKSYVLISLFTAIIAVASFITIPSPVPITLQALAIFCSLTILGGKRGLACVILYIFLGIIGLPVFSNLSGGLGHLLGATGGYILGFILTALVYYIITKHFGESTKTKAVGLSLGLLACYATGTLWYALVYLGDTSFKSILSTLAVCVAPFIIPDIIKIVAAIFIGNKLTAVVN
jgi:biotin transport system substrate-specific component